MNGIQVIRMLMIVVLNLISLRVTVSGFVTLLCLGGVVACSSSPEKRSPVSSTTVLKSERVIIGSNQSQLSLEKLDTKKNEHLVENNVQARAYLNKAKGRSIQEQPGLLLRAAEFFFAANNPRDAIATLDKINTRVLSNQEHAQYTILKAKSLSFSQQYSDSLDLLQQVNQDHLFSNKYRAEYYLVEAQGEYSVGNKDKAMIALLERENYLERSEIGDNQQRLWAIVDSSTRAELVKIRSTTGSQVLADWLDLAILANHARSVQVLPETGQNLDSPNYNALSNIASMWTSNSPQKIALLLPISSSFSGAAKALESGFLQANRNNNSRVRPNIVTYDIGNSSQATAYINQATRDGADFIVGPLGKAAAQSVLDISSPSVPIMALGGMIRNPSPLLNLFTLSPEQEMTAIARHASNRGFSKAAILFPNSPWGQRHRDALNQAWATGDRTIVSEQVYRSGSYDHGVTIKKLLGINVSAGRHNKLSATIGFKPEFSPVRRSDIDFLVLIARSGAARVIKPQLSFYQAHDLPVYSTSAVYNGTVDSVNDADLDGLMFPEMPWLLSNNNSNDSRLFAFGYDAYQLIPILTQLRSSDGLSYQGLSGRLVANSLGQIVRHPVFATFKKGIPKVELGFESKPPYQVASPLSNTKKVINRSNRYDSKNWDTRANSRN